MHGFGTDHPTEVTVSDATQSANDTTSSGASGLAGRLRSLLGAIDRNAERYLVFLIYTYLIFIIIAEVLRRFVLDFSSLWGSRTAVYAYIYLTYLGMSWAVRERTHIRLDALFDVVSDRTEGLLYILGDVMMLVFALYTLNYSLPLILTSIEFGSATQALRVNRAFFQFAVPFGFLLFSGRVIQRMYYDIQDVRHGREVYKGEAIFLEDDEEEEETGKTGSDTESDTDAGTTGGS
ncbi:TRAP transporter permease DctQ [Halobacteriales archaeon QS_3_64_16]|nr:MAG: TRAP transporter permease DctQ [Halobacteriales archaeon QS_3_64_16]